MEGRARQRDDRLVRTWLPGKCQLQDLQFAIFFLKKKQSKICNLQFSKSQIISYEIMFFHTFDKISYLQIFFRTSTYFSVPSFDFIIPSYQFFHISALFEPCVFFIKSPALDRDRVARLRELRAPGGDRDTASGQGALAH